MVTVVFMDHSRSLNIAGQTVGHVRRSVDAHNMGVPTQSQAIVDGVEVQDNFVLSNGSSLSFVHFDSGRNDFSNDRRDNRARGYDQRANPGFQSDQTVANAERDRLANDPRNPNDDPRNPHNPNDPRNDQRTNDPRNPNDPNDPRHDARNDPRNPSDPNPNPNRSTNPNDPRQPNPSSQPFDPNPPVDPSRRPFDPNDPRDPNRPNDPNDPTRQRDPNDRDGTR